MYKVQHMEQALLPELDDESARHQNCLHFLFELLPLLESLRETYPERYNTLLRSYETTESGLESANLEDLLEYTLTHLKSAYGIEFRVHIGENTYQIESIGCPLVRLQELRTNASEIERKTLCWHCSQFHFEKFFRRHQVEHQLRLFPESCEFEVEKPPRHKRVNPLVY